MKKSQPDKFSNRKPSERKPKRSEKSERKIETSEEKT
jgi:hypothetical protein